jgi:hypothetical protein
VTTVDATAQAFSSSVHSRALTTELVKIKKIINKDLNTEYLIKKNPPRRVFKMLRSQLVVVIALT